MNNIQKIRRSTVAPAMVLALAFCSGDVQASGLFGPESLNGDFVISADGGFVAVTPFAPEPLRLYTALIGRIELDGAGQALGEYTISFHNPAVPFGVRSRFEAIGTYEISTDGHMFIELQEFKVEPPAADDGVADGIVRFECYVVRRQSEARCVLNSLISLQQGPDPVPEPATLSGSLRRQD